uniref:Tripartite motif containing 13 n=1 Tax=Latimeria chalumnae TaxID=7897 RepID=H3AZV0_LATCH
QNAMELLEEDLTCPICCCLFDDPRVLPCFHNFCKKCLEGILEGSNRTMLWRPPFRCPTCRKETPTSVINNLQVNYSLRGIVEKYNKIKGTPQMPVCKVHNAQPLNIFCLTDHKLICGFCATMEDHKKHALCSIEEAYTQEKKAFEDLFNGFESWRCADVLSCLETLETNKKKALQLLTKDAAKVTEYFEKLQHTLEQKRNEILSDFETMKLVVMQAYDPEINKLTMILAEQKGAFSIAESFKDVSDPVIFLQQMQEFREKVKVIKETRLPSCIDEEATLVMKNFDTAQWDSMQLKDVDKLALPQGNSASGFKIFSKYSYAILITFILISLYMAGLTQSVVDKFSSLRTHVSIVTTSYLTDTAGIVDDLVLYWSVITDTFSSVCQGCESYSQSLLNYFTDFFLKKKAM